MNYEICGVWGVWSCESSMEIVLYIYGFLIYDKVFVVLVSWQECDRCVGYINL